jgi:hypothetical protein
VKTDEKVIGGFKYRMEQIGMEDGEQVMLRLAQPLAGLLSRAASDGMTEATARQLLMTGLGPALKEITGDDLKFVREKFAAATVVFLPDGAKVREWPLAEHYNEHFKGRYGDWLTWLVWGVTMNRFFGDAPGRLMASWASMAKETEGSRSKFPPEPEAGGPGVSSSPSTDARA